MIKFRTDINALRALAVIAVVIFHFAPTMLPGGFAGVDVFFVISGYLMTSIIVTRVKDNSFSLLDFYLARANRILPALATLCIVLLILGFFFLVPWDYKTVGRDVASSIAFLSNVMFSLRTGYFSTKGNFLLHTWSLSVEWQFYLVYPLIILCLSKLLSFSNLKKALLVITLLSFLSSLIVTDFYPNQSYFLFPTRAWEMLLGGIAFLYPVSVTNKNKYLLNIFGFIFILSSYFFVSNDIAWPGIWTVVPTLGAYLIIVSNLNNNFFTNSSLIQKIGLWSYSIYLWHWPVVIAFQYYGINKVYLSIGVAVSVVLGILSYYFVEQKTAFLRDFSRVKAFFVHSFVILSLGLLGTYVFMTQGVAQRLVLSGNPIVQGGTGENYKINEGTILLNTQNDYDYLLIGDSNANQYTRGILAEGTKVKQAWYGACMSFPNSIFKREKVYLSWKENCSNNYKIAIDSKVPVILTHLWTKPDFSLECVTGNCVLSGDYYQDLEVNLRELLSVYKNDKVYLLGDIPRPPRDIITCMQTNYLLGTSFSCKTKAKYSKKILKFNKLLESVSNDFENVTFIPLAPKLCNGDECTYDVNGKSLFMSDLHLSSLGSELMWKYIMSEIEKKN